MKVAIMQPYFMPYIGYISLIKHTDKFVLFDTVQFIRHGWIERNRVLKQDDGWMYIQAPLKKSSRDTLIKDKVINNSTAWQQKILAQLQHYKKTAPYYLEVIELLNDVFSKNFESITLFNKNSLEIICSYLGFPKPICIFSEMNLKIEEATEADEWALNICNALPYDNISYINPIGGLDFFNREKYEQQGISIFFQKMHITEYNQKKETFQPGLSIIDALMFNSVAEVNEMLDNYELI